MTTKRKLASSFAVLALALGGCGGDDEESGGSGGAPTEGGAAKARATVDIKDFKFASEAVKVKVGGAVTWKNADNALHTAQTDAGANGAFSTGDLRMGDSKTVTFDEPGRFAYYCIYHRFMTATVEVSE